MSSRGQGRRATLEPNPIRENLVGCTLTGSRGERYRLGQCLAEGGQGWIFLATMPGTAPSVVVKVLKPHAVTEDSWMRFQREADVLRRISQDGSANRYVVRYFDHFQTAEGSRGGLGGEIPRLPFTVLEYISGPSLEEVLDSYREQDSGPMPLARTRRVLAHVARALTAVHAHGVIHRDLKPSNILLASIDGVEVAKVTDFGLARDASRVDRTAAIAGASVGFAPPEQFEHGNARVSAATDVFAFAAIAYECLTGVRAFPGDNALAVLARIVRGERPRLPRGGMPELAPHPDTIAAIDSTLAAALDADPAKRPSTVASFWALLDAAFETVLGRALSGAAANSMVPAHEQSSNSILPTLERSSNSILSELERSSNSILPSSRPLDFPFLPLSNVRNPDGRVWSAASFSTDGTTLFAVAGWPGGPEGNSVVRFTLEPGAAKTQPFGGMLYSLHDAPILSVLATDDSIVVASATEWACFPLVRGPGGQGVDGAPTPVASGRAPEGLSIAQVARGAQGSLWVFGGNDAERRGFVARVGIESEIHSLPFVPLAGTKPSHRLRAHAPDLSLVIGGDDGSVAYLRRSVSILRPVADTCFFAGATTEDVAFLFGTGGHAYRFDSSVDPKADGATSRPTCPAHRLLPVGSSQDLLCAAADPTGCVVVGANGGRVLRWDGRVFQRLPNTVTSAPTRAISLTERGLWALFEDGTIAHAPPISGATESL